MHFIWVGKWTSRERMGQVPINHPEDQERHQATRKGCVGCIRREHRKLLQSLGIMGTGV